MKSIRLVTTRLAALFALFALGTSAFAQGTPVIQISGANFRPVPLAVAAVEVEGGNRGDAQEFDTAFLFDLTASGLFQVLDRKGFLATANEGWDASKIQFKRWGDVGAESLIKTKFNQAGGGVRAELRLFTVASGKQDFSTEVTAGNARQLAHGLADAVYKFFTREPGPFDSHLAFVKRSGKEREVWYSDWDGKNARLVQAQGLNMLPHVGPNGLVGFTSYASGKPDILVWKEGRVNPLVKKGEMATGISYSPDASKIAYALASGQSTQIWIANADGSDARKLTDTPYFINTSPSWSPDGKRLAFVSDRGGSPQIYAMNIDGSGVKRLTFQGRYNQTPDWSPRGDLVAFTARDERNAFDIFTVNVDSGKIVRLTQGEGNNEEPAFSPNGRLIVFTSTRAGGSRLYVTTLDGNTVYPLPAEGASIVTPDWGR